MKNCSKCNEEKPLEAFRKWRTACKACIAQERKTPEFKARERERDRERQREKPRATMLKRTRDRARVKGIECNLEIEDIIIPTHCPILNIELNINSGVAGDDSPSLDKIDPELGYIKGNVRVISRLANIMKAHATREQLILFSNNIINYLDYGNTQPEQRQNTKGSPKSMGEE
jgi:hypothetical protein